MAKTPPAAATPAALRDAIVPFAPFPFTEDDALLIDVARYYEIVDQQGYAAGFETLRDIGDLLKRVEAHHDAWRRPLNAYRTPALAAAKSDTELVEEAKDHLARALPAWKRLADERDAAEKRRLQAAADEAAAAAQKAQQATLLRVADSEADPDMQSSLRAQAAAVVAVPPVARPVSVAPTAVTPRGGVIPKRMVPEIHDVRALLRAWLDGRCQLDIEQALIDAITPKLRDAAGTMGTNISAVYPGVTAREDEKAHVR